MTSWGEYDALIRYWWLQRDRLISRILRHALDLIAPDVTDFFRFIDLDEPHPFWGTGNLVKFAEGLVRIDIQNRVLFVLDNDAEGVKALNRLQRLRLPTNLRATALPDLPSFEDFPARGPQGIANSDINARAAAIECYLDLNLPARPPASVVWSNYRKDLDTWQGALEHKESYMRHFLAQSPSSVAENGYDLTKLEQVVSAIMVETKALAGT